MYSHARKTIATTALALANVFLCAASDVQEQAKPLAKNAPAFPVGIDPKTQPDRHVETAADGSYKVTWTDDLYSVEAVGPETSEIFPKGTKHTELYNKCGRLDDPNTKDDLEGDAAVVIETPYGGVYKYQYRNGLRSNFAGPAVWEIPPKGPQHKVYYELGELVDEYYTDSSNRSIDTPPGATVRIGRPHFVKEKGSVIWEESGFSYGERFDDPQRHHAMAPSLVVVDVDGGRYTDFLDKDERVNLNHADPVKWYYQVFWYDDNKRLAVTARMQTDGTFEKVRYKDGRIISEETRDAQGNLITNPVSPKPFEYPLTP